MQHEDQYKSFLALFAEVEDMNELAKRFGFYKHERWQVACHEKTPQEAENNSCCSNPVFYGCGDSVQPNAGSQESPRKASP